MIFLKNNTIIRKNLEKSEVYEVGFAKVDAVLPYAVSIVVPLSPFVLSQIADQPTFEYFHHYRTVNTFIDNALLKCGLEIGRNGYKYLCVGASHSVGEYTGVFQHKTAARLAGLGYIGKSALFISHKYGPGVRLGTILTDMPFETGTPCETDCGDCDLCKRACPAMAIRGVNYREGINRSEMFDAKACSEYMKQKFQHIGRGSVCGICIKSCKMCRL